MTINTITKRTQLRNHLNELISKRPQARRNKDSIKHEIETNWKFFQGLKKKQREAEIDGDKKKAFFCGKRKIELLSEIKKLTLKYKAANELFEDLCKQIKKVENEMRHVYITKDEEVFLIKTFQDKTLPLEERNLAAAKLFSELELLIRWGFYHWSQPKMHEKCSYEEVCGIIYDKFYRLLDTFDVNGECRFVSFFSSWLRHPGSMFSKSVLYATEYEINSLPASDNDEYNYAADQIKAAFAKITKKKVEKIEFIKLLIDGYNKKEAAEKIGICADTATNWFKEFTKIVIEDQRAAA